MSNSEIFFEGWTEGLRVDKGNGFLGILSEGMPRMWCVPLAGLFICGCISSPGWEVVSPGWRDLVTLREELTCLVKGVCCQQMTGTGFMQIPAGRGGPLYFGKWQGFLKLPAWFNGGERVADKDTAPQVEEKHPQETGNALFDKSQITARSSTTLILRGRVCITCRRFGVFLKPHSSELKNIFF